jgi:ABC-2 type transport system permease protein
VYFSGFSKSQEAKSRRAGGRKLLDIASRITERAFGGDMGAVAGKEIRTFFRDNSQWSQLLLLGALIAVYLYNFSALPLEQSPIRVDFLQNQLAFMNMALAGLVLSAVSARFVFPAVSAEGEAYWIILTSPMKMKRFLRGKAVLYLVPLLILAEMLVVFTNRLLDASPMMRTLSMITMAFMAAGIVSLAIGLGARYPRFRHENIAQVATGFGGVVFMIVSSLFVVAVLLLEAVPVYLLFMAEVRGHPVSPYQWAFIFGSFTAALGLCIAVIVKPMKMAERTLTIY